MRSGIFLCLILFACATDDDTTPIPGCPEGSRCGSDIDGVGTPADEERYGVRGEGEAESEAESETATCASHEECDDGDTCTDDYCTSVGCESFDNSECVPCTVTETSDCDGDGVTVADGDCDDKNAGVSPDVVENAEAGNLLDSKDNDCDGVIDEWGPGPDADGDRVRDDLDCDPYDADRWPHAPEICNDGVDSNCDGEDSFVESDANSFCSVAVGTVDGLNLAGTGLTRIYIQGNIPEGLSGVASSDILSVSVGTEALSWDETEDAYGTPWRGANHAHEIVFPSGPFVPRVRTRDGSVIYFDLEEWNLTGSLHRIPSRDGVGVVLAP